MLDLAIRNGLVVDGTAAAPVEADVGIERGRIVATGSVGSARQVLDAGGLVAASARFRIAPVECPLTSWQLTGLGGPMPSTRSCCVSKGSAPTWPPSLDTTRCCDTTTPGLGGTRRPGCPRLSSTKSDEPLNRVPWASLPDSSTSLAVTLRQRISSNWPEPRHRSADSTARTCETRAKA